MEDVEKKLTAGEKTSERSEKKDKDEETSGEENLKDKDEQDNEESDGDKIHMGGESEEEQRGEAEGSSRRGPEQ